MRKPKVLFVSRFCLLDTSSGAAMATREMLRQLALRDFETAIIGATIFDSLNGREVIRAKLDSQNVRRKGIVSFKDGELFHSLVRTEDYRSGQMTLRELDALYSLFMNTLDSFDPDVLFFYGGNSFENLITLETTARRIPSVAFMANANYRGRRWCKNVDYFTVDTQLTAKMYERRLGVTPNVNGTFIQEKDIKAESLSRKHVTFINPLPRKGGLIVAQLAEFLENRRPDIVFEIVESRGAWQDVMETLARHHKRPYRDLNNVVVTEHTNDMRSVYSRSRIVMMLSLHWEGAGRVLAEAMLNGIPAIATNRGGQPEMIGDGGIKLDLPSELYAKPYNRLLSPDEVSQIAALIERFFDDEEYYQAFVKRAKIVGQERHNLTKNGDALATFFENVCAEGPRQNW